MDSGWEYTCTSVNTTDAHRITRHLAEVARDGWELVSASVHKATAPQGGYDALVDQCTIFWKKPAARDRRQEPENVDLDLSTVPAPECR